MTDSLAEQLDLFLKDLRLPTMRRVYQPLAQQALQNSHSFERYLFDVASAEHQAQTNNTIRRFLRESQLPHEKTLATFDLSRLPLKLQRQFQALLDGAFLARAENVLVFGKPGAGKTHLLCALAHELVQKKHRVLFAKCALLVQRLLKAKNELRLALVIKQLSRFEALIIDDIGYVQHSRDEMEVLFTLLAERYERQSVLISSNLPFSKWESIFKDPMTAAAAIDRLVHHSVVLELNIPSYRTEEALKKVKPR